MKKFEEILAVAGGLIKGSIFLMLVVALVPLALVYKRVDPRHAFVIPQFFHRLLLRLLGIRLLVSGSPATTAPILFVANHASSLDIPILGSLVPASFVSKAEVSSYPLFGFLARVQNTLFIEKRSVKAADQREQLTEHVQKGYNLIMFPEGDSTDGLTVLPFKSSLFSIVEDAKGALTVQAISIACTKLDGRPMSAEDRHKVYVWHGDTSLLPHLWAVFTRGRFTIDVVFHEPLTHTEGMNRKLLAMTCQDMVARGIEHSLTGQAAPQQPILPAN